ncbi:putative quinol monooxygenase [Novipirellula sp.]|uniref:putative quinol monooxygenase n=1 Tax=Novipirellula sp. TaxID=2795430 RepID=UPI003564B475
MAHLTIVADIKAKADKVDLVKSELLKLIAPTHAEPGCVQYDLHQNNENPAHFLFYENWESRELWQMHSNSNHVKELAAATEDAIEELSIYEMTKVGS